MAGIFFSMGRLENQPNKFRGSLELKEKQLRLSTLKSMATCLLSGVCESRVLCRFSLCNFCRQGLRPDWVRTAIIQVTYLFHWLLLEGI